MGSILVAVCKKCGFEKEIFFGGGMLDFDNVCIIPAVNKKTGKFIIKNYLNKSTYSDNIIFYNQPEMYSGVIDEGAHQWCDVYLKRKDNYCPECKGFTLDFEFAGCFD